MALFIDEDCKVVHDTRIADLDSDFCGFKRRWALTAIRLGSPNSQTPENYDFGGLQSSVKGTRVNVRWRRKFLGAPDITTPRRNTTDEAIQDYIFCSALRGLDHYHCSDLHFCQLVWVAESAVDSADAGC